MSTLVICEFADDCNNGSCSYKQPTTGSTMYKAMCGHVSRKIDIIEYNEIGVDNPNYKFKRMKDGF